MDSKKISFGFTKLKKPTLIQYAKKVEKVEKSDVQFIDCLEGSSIKVIGGEEKRVKEPLIIPMKPNKKLLNLEDIVKNDFVVNDSELKIDNEQKNSTEGDMKPDEALTLNELAARELLKDVTTSEIKNESNRVIEATDPDKLVLEGEKEPTIDDYEDVPIEEFGLAMLRGMGWKEGTGIGKNQKVIVTQLPLMRPKGMGLGADKLAKQSADTKPAVDKDGKLLTCCKRAYVKVIAGYHKGSYGQIMGFDDESGRFIIKTAINNSNLSLNEFLVTPVTKEDYMKNSKVINNAKYEEYLKKTEETKNEPKPGEESSEEERKRIKNNIKKEKFSLSDDERQKTKKHVSSRPESDKNKLKIKKEKYSDFEDEKYDKREKNYDKYKKNLEETKNSQRSSRKEEKGSTLEERDKSRSSKSYSEEHYRKTKKKDSKRDKKYDSSDESDDKQKSKNKYSDNEEKSKRKSKKDKDQNSKRQNSRNSEEDYKKSHKERSKHSDSEENDEKYNSKSKKDKKLQRESKRRDSTSSEDYKKDQKEKSKYSDSEDDYKRRKDDKYKKNKDMEDRHRRKEKKYDTDSEEERYKKKRDTRDRSDIRKQKSSHKDKERDRSRHDKYRR